MIKFFNKTMHVFLNQSIYFHSCFPWFPFHLINFISFDVIKEEFIYYSSLIVFMDFICLLNWVLREANEKKEVCMCGDTEDLLFFFFDI